MTQNKVMKLWTAIVTAFLALFTALGLVTATAATAATAAAQPESPRTDATHHAAPAIPATPRWVWSHARALPPTMKQRIGAEAHGKSPSCRHRPLTDTQAENTEITTPDQDPAALDC
ncbi:DUF6344 domain-containing protein [Streptomyces sp. NPDC048362]|uniref:DUF6344 domain-containing protein n=1 Tax=unclassified Streptomyces TaxID=2593676 RepID=UPI00340954B0